MTHDTPTANPVAEQAAAKVVANLALLITQILAPQLTEQDQQFNRTVQIQHETIEMLRRTVATLRGEIQALGKRIADDEASLREQITDLRVDVEQLGMRVRLAMGKANSVSDLVAEDRRFMAKIREVVNGNAEFAGGLADAQTELEGRVADLESVTWPKPAPAAPPADPCCGQSPDDEAFELGVPIRKQRSPMSPERCTVQGHCPECRADHAPCCGCGTQL